MFENLSERLERSFKILKGEGKITEINVAETLKDVGSHHPARSRGTSDGVQTVARRVSRAIHSQGLRSSCRRI